MRQLKISKTFTDRESLSVDKYLVEISRYDLLTLEEEVELAQRIHAGNRIALEKLTNANLRFVVSVAKQYQNQGLSLPDLINEGNLGLIKAAEKFDETHGFKFISYAVWWIRQSILKALVEQSRIVRLPSNTVNVLNKINKAFSRFEQENERRPSSEELAEQLDISVDKITDIINVSNPSISLDNSLVEGGGDSLIDLMIDLDSINPESESIKKSLSHDIESLFVNLLTHKQIDVLKKFFGIGTREMSLEEIGKGYNLTGERIRQIKDKSLKILRDSFKKNILRSYLN